MDQIEDVKASSTDRDQFDPVLALLAADRRNAFSDYLGQRERLQHLASDIVRSYDGHVSPRQILTRGLLMAGVVMAPSAAALIAWQRGRSAAGQPPVAGTGFGRTLAAEPDRPAGDRRSAALITAART